MFLSGVTVTIGPKRALKFFVRQQNIGGSFAVVGGLTLVVCGWPIVGACMEFYGFLALFSAFFPTVFLFLKRFPIVGTFISGPWVKNLIAKLAKTSQHLLPVWSIRGACMKWVWWRHVTLLSWRLRRVTLPTVLSEVRGYVRACCSSFCMRPVPIVLLMRV